MAPIVAFVQPCLEVMRSADEYSMVFVSYQAYPKSGLTRIIASPRATKFDGREDAASYLIQDSSALRTQNSQHQNQIILEKI